jgi:hypothetical protein
MDRALSAWTKDSSSSPSSVVRGGLLLREQVEGSPLVLVADSDV